MEVQIRTFDGQEASGTLDDLGRAAQMVKGVVGPIPDHSVVAENDYRRVPTRVVTLCQELINRYHDPLRSARIGLVFRAGPWKSKGRETWGTAEKVSGKWRAMAGDLDFLITLNEEVWERISEAQRRALLDHELMHCQFDERELKASLRGHDIEEFHAIIARHGAWRDDLVATEDAFETNKQLRLGFNEAPRGKVVAVEPATSLERDFRELDDEAEARGEEKVLAE